MKPTRETKRKIMKYRDGKIKVNRWIVKWTSISSNVGSI